MRAHTPFITWNVAAFLSFLFCTTAIASNTSSGPIVAKPAYFGKVVVVEYYNATLDHYFMTGSFLEQDVLDSGQISGWARTGEGFQAYDIFQRGPDIKPVCRYYGLPSAGLDTHFFSALVSECGTLLEQWPDEWELETPNAFMVELPDPISGACRIGTTPVHRLYNNRADVNHRYTTSQAIAQEMENKGWILEGYGPDGVAMCAIESIAPATSGIASPG